MIYRVNDIRGEYPREINATTAEFLGHQYALHLRRQKLPPRLLLALDNRPSSRILAAAFRNGFNGKTSVLGVIPTPIFYHEVLRRKTAGVMITASHLRRGSNGFKCFLPTGETWVYHGQLPRAKGAAQRATNVSIELPDPTPLLLAYLRQLRRYVRFTRPVRLRFASSTSVQGALIQLLPRVFPQIRLSATANYVLHSDSDGDRIELAWRGRRLLPEQLLALLLAAEPRYRRIGINPLISTRNASYFPDRTFIRIPTGHRFFKEAYRRYRLDLALEYSGHIYCFRELGTEAPLLGALKTLAFAGQHNPDTFIAERPFHLWRFDLSLKQISLARATAELRQQLNRSYSVTMETFDGVELQLRSNGAPVGRVHLRASNHETTLRFLVEATDRTHFRKLKRIVSVWRKKNS